MLPMLGWEWMAVALAVVAVCVVASAFRRRTRARVRANRNELGRHFAREAEWRELGYVEWLYTPPQRGTLIEAKRHEWECVEMPWARPSAIWRAGDGPPEMNVAGLWWRPALEPPAQEPAPTPCDDWTPVS